MLDWVGRLPLPDSCGSGTVRGLSPCTTVSVVAVESSTATPSASVDMVRSWSGWATGIVRAVTGVDVVPWLGCTLAGRIPTTVPSLATSTHSVPVPSNLPPATPGGNRNGWPTGVNAIGSSWRTTPCTASMTNAASRSRASVTPRPAVVCVVAAICSVARSSELTLPVVRSRRTRYRSLWLTSITWPCASTTLKRVSTRPVSPLTRAISPRLEE